MTEVWVVIRVYDYESTTVVAVAATGDEAKVKAQSTEHPYGNDFRIPRLEWRWEPTYWDGRPAWVAEACPGEDEDDDTVYGWSGRMVVERWELP